MLEIHVARAFASRWPGFPKALETGNGATLCCVGFAGSPDRYESRSVPW